MPTSEITCAREGCTETFRVGKEEGARCPSCGEKHTPPWPHQQSASASETSDSSTQVTAAPGTMVRITIEIETVDDE